MAKKANSILAGLTRSVSINRESMNREKRTLDLAFSSEEPVDRWGENEILSHRAGDFDFDRLNHDHPLLLGHAEYDPRSQIGVIERAWVDGDKGRATVRFGNSALAEEIFKDVQDGIRKLISVGYDRTGIVESKKAQDGRVTTRYRWQPTHIAIVPVPADTTVGIGRSKKRVCPDCDGVGECPDCDGDGEDESAEDGRCGRCGGSGRCADCRGNGYIVTAKSKTVDSPQHPKTGKEPKNNMSEAATVEVNESEIRTQEAEKTKLTVAAERARHTEITSIADRLIELHGARDNGEMAKKIRTMANDAISKDETAGSFSSRCMTEVCNAKPAKPTTIADCTDQKGRERYSILRGIQSVIKRGCNGAIPDGVEGEVHAEMVKASKEAGGTAEVDADAGFRVPHDATLRMGREWSRKRFAREMQSGIFAQGGAFIPTELRIPIIEILRNEEVMSKVGMQTIAGLQGNIVIPRQEAAATAQSVSETGALALSLQILGQIALSPRRIGVAQQYTRLFLLQSSPDAEEFMRADMLAVLALLSDRLALNGQGAANEPLGVMNTPGIGSIVFGTTPTYAKIVAMETALRVANVRNANAGPLAYLSTPKTRGSLKTVAVTLTGATTVVGGASNAIWTGSEDDGEMNATPSLSSNQVPNDQIVLGAFQQLVRGVWGGLNVIVNPYTLAKQDEYEVVMNMYLDFAVRHPQAFLVSADSGAQ